MIQRFSLFYLVIFIMPYLAASPLSLEVQGKAVVLMNGKTGKILFEKEQDLLIYPASTTKIATALFILEKYQDRLGEEALATREALATIAAQVKKESNYRCPAYWLESDGTHMAIKQGELLPMKDLLSALLIRSPNDAANVMAVHCSGSVSKFMEELQAYCKEIGLEKSYFMNPHGLHHPMHRTTAKEMALLTCRALRYPLFQEIVVKSSYKFPQTNLEYERILAQTNGLVKKGAYYYPYAKGGKTGTTKAAGKCLVAIAEKEGRLLVAALFGYAKKDELYADATQLFEKAFAEKKRRMTLLEAGSHPFKGEVMGKQRSLVATLEEPLYYDFYPSEREPVSVHVEMAISQLPVRKGDKMGELLIRNRVGEIMGRQALYTAKTIRADFVSWLKQHVGWKRGMAMMGCPALLFFLRQFTRKNKAHKRSRDFS